MHVYIPMRPHETGHPQGGGYQCGACGLQGLAFGEPHYRSAGAVCEPAVPDTLADNHPQKAFGGKPISARAAQVLGSGHLLERLDDTGQWIYDDLAPQGSITADTAAPALSELGQVETPAAGSGIPDGSANDGPAGTQLDPAGERIPSLDEYVAAGYDASTYAERFGLGAQTTTTVPDTVAPISEVAAGTPVNPPLSTETPEGGDGEYTT